MPDTGASAALRLFCCPFELHRKGRVTHARSLLGSGFRGTDSKAESCIYVCPNGSKFFDVEGVKDTWAKGGSSAAE